MSSLLFYPDVNFLKQIWKLSKCWLSARILPQHIFIFLSELTRGKVSFRVQTFKQVIYFYLQITKEGNPFAIYSEWKYIKLYLTENAWNKAVIEIYFFHFFKKGPKLFILCR